MARTSLSDEKVSAALAELKGWKREGSTAVAKTFTLKDHIAALGFVVKVATIAETLDHHPTVDWTYNKVRFVLSTHYAGGLTPRDFELAARIDAVK